MPGRFQGLQALNGLVRAQRASTDVDTPREVITREGLEQAAREEFARRRKTAGFPTAISLDPDFTGAGQMPRKQAEGAMSTITDFLPPFAEAKDVSRAIEDPSMLNLGVAGLAALGPAGRLFKPVGKLFKSTAKNVVVNKAEREAAAKMSESELQQIVVKQEYPIKVHHGTPHLANLSVAEKAQARGVLRMGLGRHTLQRILPRESFTEKLFLEHGYKL
mgnify:CR=1 FL=1